MRAFKQGRSTHRDCSPIPRYQLEVVDPAVTDEQVLQLLLVKVALLQEHKDSLLAGRACLWVKGPELHAQRMPDAVAVTVMLEVSVAVCAGTLRSTT